MGEKLTKSDVAKIEEEINYRKLVVRKNAIEAVKEARAQGDLSENFEYYAAKRENSFTLCAVPYPFFFSCRVPVPPSTTPSWSSTATMVPKKHFTSMPKLRCST